MRKILTLLLCGALLASCFTLPAAAVAITPATPADFDLPCQAAILVDLDTGTVLYEKNADEQRPIASITKVMTLLLTFRALEAGKVRLTDLVPVSEHAYGMGGSQIWLEPGEEMTLDDMLKAICISSANDAAVAVAEYIGGSEDAFVQQMNAEAARLGMASTHFENACGLDETGHLSTARDVAVMSREMLLHHTEIAHYCTIWTDTLRGGETQLVNTNKLLKSYPGITGLKTGTTGGAGVCITASAERDGLGLVAVILGAPSGKDRFDAARTLLDYGFANYQSLVAELPGDAPDTLPVTHGAAETVPLTYTAPGSVLTAKGDAAPLEVHLDLPQSVEAPVTAGQQLGTVTLTHGGQTVAEYPVTAADDVAALSFGLCFVRLVEACLMHG
ncbi:D-alanyl-D-alanine carboxypeptidase family protein [uncultured Gemmiger sp.]|uniref:D-alanyl-D-alanine carboxypeptidase family protein n=1 Tax=uncultured Gemmiger sp. TaxID=1623490 RepID=UPI0025DD0689|nr:D-alanyl-D-alanine carboxypeptidase family protein [uncultured Gemmiger sp.]